MRASVKSSASIKRAPDHRLTGPLKTLLAFQQPLFFDPSRFVIGLWSRQTGKSHVGMGRAVSDCLAHSGNLWVVLSAGERQSLEAMRKGHLWREAYGATLTDYREVRDAAEAVLKSAEMTFANGSRIVALPANPDTARGYSANLFLDEFAFHERPDAIWRAVYPSISNPLKGLKTCLVMSTPNGRGNKFSDLWHSEGTGWSKHRVTIHDAVAGGLALNIDELRRGLNDPEGWAQEYECEFIDGAAILLPYELLAKCESPEASVTAPPGFWTGARRPNLYVGIDFGRKRDLTVCWTLERLGDVLHTREVLTLEKLSTPDQVELLRPRIAAARRVGLDYTGPGVGLGDYLAKEFHEWNPEAHRFGRLELCTFGNALKVDVFSKLRIAFEGVKLRIPVDRACREDLHAVHRVSLPGGGITYRAPHTADGHSDRAVALALAVRAAASGSGVFSYAPVRVARPSVGRLGRRMAQ